MKGAFSTLRPSYQPADGEPPALFSGMPAAPVAFRRAAVALAVATTGACAEPPVRWRESATIQQPPADHLRFAVDAEGRVAWLPPEAPPPGALPSADVCPGSLRVARSVGREMYAVWWSARPDSSAALLAARSTDGGLSWPQVAPVDTADRSVSGCRRPPPSLAADASSGYVHVAYALAAPGAPGVFFAHSMPGQFLFHAPVPIVYGERPGRTSVASSGDVVAVAYEDPNTAEPRVGLALSRTQGHTFDHRLYASTGVGAAIEPRVAIAGGTLAVAWRQSRSMRGGIGLSAGSDAPLVVRLGELAGP